MNRPLIIIVNADQEFLEMIAEFLNDEGYEALTLHEDAMTLRTIKQRMPALVVLELTVLDPEAGWMVLNKMRLDPQTTHLPVIMASIATDLIARNEQHLREKRCDILIKPFDLEELLVIVDKYALR